MTKNNILRLLRICIIVMFAMLIALIYMTVKCQVRGIINTLTLQFEQVLQSQGYIPLNDIPNGYILSIDPNKNIIQIVMPENIDIDIR